MDSQGLSSIIEISPLSEDLGKKGLFSMKVTSVEMYNFLVEGL